MVGNGNKGSSITGLPCKALAYSITVYPNELTRNRCNFPKLFQGLTGG